MDTSLLAKRFKGFAERECKGSSRLYGHLAEHIAADRRLLRMSAQSSAGQPVPNLFLGAVQYLLLRGVEHPLMEYYPSIVDDPREPFAAFPHFKEFCLQYEDELILILQSKLVQTNEVRRCAYLYPCFCSIHHLTEKPLALIEIGTSAGLQLLWDKYSYSYHTGLTCGNKQSPLEIVAEIRGDHHPLLFPESPPVSSRLGVDLHVNHVQHPDDYLWLKALIWPEHKERIIQFDKAAAYASKERLELFEGDGVALLPHLASKIAEDSTVCVFHTHVANQLPYESKLRLEEHLRVLGQERDVFHLYNHMWDVDLHLDYYMNGQEYRNTVAKTDGHGRWFEWRL